MNATRRPKLLAPLAAGAAMLLAPLLIIQACGQSSTPEVHDNVVNDTHPTATPTQTSPPPPADAGVDPDATLYDAPYRAGPPDGYAPSKGCAKCACAGDGDAGTYCFGGGGGKTTFGATCDVDASGSIEVGCNPIPEACLAGDPKQTCACILDAIGHFPCYLVCALSATGYTVYCPSP